MEHQDAESDENPSEPLGVQTGLNAQSICLPSNIEDGQRPMLRDFRVGRIPTSNGGKEWNRGAVFEPLNLAASRKAPIRLNLEGDCLEQGFATSDRLGVESPCETHPVVILEEICETGVIQFNVLNKDRHVDNCVQTHRTNGCEFELKPHRIGGERRRIPNVCHDLTVSGLYNCLIHMGPNKPPVVVNVGRDNQEGNGTIKEEGYDPDFVVFMDGLTRLGLNKL